VVLRDLDPANEVALRGRAVSIWLAEYSVYNEYVYLPWSGRQCSLFRP
jgi:hypothetical protein